jgi:hypothetical protein
MSGIQYPVPHLPMLGKGSILVDIFDSNQNPTGALHHLGNCTKLELDIKDDIAELYQSLTSTPSLIASAVKKRQPKITIEGTDFAADHIGIAQMSAGPTSLATAAATFTTETLAAANVPKKGRFFKTANMNIDNVTTPPVVKSGATTLVAGTSLTTGDYFVADPVTGMIYIPAGSTEVDANALTVTYNTLVGTFNQVAGGTVPFVRGHILFVPDPVDGQAIQLDAWRVNLSPNGKIGLIADDYGNWTLDGNILDDTANHPLAPFFQYTFFTGTTF